jgi:hypothetical protein
MKLFRLILVFIFANFVGGIVAFASTPAAARPATQNLRWKKPVIQIVVSTSLTEPSNNIKTNSDVLGALSRSLDAWSNAAGIEFQLEFSDKQNVSPQGPKGDGVSLITIAQSAENLLFFARDPFSEAARTRIFYNKKGYITEADIVLNPFQQFSTDGTYGTFDLETTFAHEIGHLLGLRHSAVMGSLMSDKVERNTTQKTLDSNAPILSGSDVTAIRNLYGTNNYEDCCGAITGKLLLQSGKAARQTIVWAEDSETGLIVGQTETSADGSYRIGGLKNGGYSLFWQRKEGFDLASGEVGGANVEKNNASLATQKIAATRSDVLLSHIGVGMQLGDSAVELKAGGEYLIVLGGKNLNVNSVSLEFNSPYLQAENGSMCSEDYGDDIEVISFILKVDKETPTGTYSIFARDSDGKRTAMIGAISVRKTLK